MKGAVKNTAPLLLRRRYMDIRNYVAEEMEKYNGVCLFLRLLKLYIVNL